MCSGCGYTRFEVIGSYRVFLQRAVFDVCAVAGSFAICGGRLQCNGCMHVATTAAMCVDTCGLAIVRCRSHCNGCIKVPRCCGCARHTIVFCSWALGIVNRIGVAASRLRY